MEHNKIQDKCALWRFWSASQAHWSLIHLKNKSTGVRIICCCVQSICNNIVKPFKTGNHWNNRDLDITLNHWYLLQHLHQHYSQSILELICWFHYPIQPQQQPQLQMPNHFLSFGEFWKYNFIWRLDKSYEREISLIFWGKHFRPNRSPVLIKNVWVDICFEYPSVWFLAIPIEVVELCRFWFPSHLLLTQLPEAQSLLAWQ